VGSESKVKVESWPVTSSVESQLSVRRTCTAAAAAEPAAAAAAAAGGGGGGGGADGGPQRRLIGSLSSPFIRQDIFYTGSVTSLREYKTSHDMATYVQVGLREYKTGR